MLREYKVIHKIGEKEETIFCSKSFDHKDGYADWAAFRETKKELDKYRISLLSSGKREEIEKTDIILVRIS